MSNCPQSNVKVRKRLKTWQQQTTCKHQQNNNSVWVCFFCKQLHCYVYFKGWIKFHNSFGKLIDDESLQLQQKILKVFVRKNVNQFVETTKATICLDRVPRSLAYRQKFAQCSDQSRSRLRSIFAS